MSITQRLHEWAFSAKGVWLVPNDSLPATLHPATLRCALEQAMQLQAPGVPVYVAGWQRTAELAGVLAAWLPMLPHLRFDDGFISYLRGGLNP